jgi:hypothetical protein
MIHYKDNAAPAKPGRLLAVGCWLFWPLIAPVAPPKGGQWGCAAGTAALPPANGQVKQGAHSALGLNAELALRYLYFDVYTLSLIK